MTRMKESANPLDVESLRKLAGEFVAGQIDASEFRQQLERLERHPGHPNDANFHVDLDRRDRCGQAEVVFGSGKSYEDLIGIFETLLKAGQDVFATRIEKPTAEMLLERFPRGTYHEIASTFRLDPESDDEGNDSQISGRVLVVTAGSGDRPVAEEARQTLDWMRVECSVMADVGVAGPHRLVSRVDELRGHDAIVVAAGMEGALPSVVAGYVDCPVIAVPTSVGYGAAFGGVAALLGMLNSCAAHVAVVNIDAGFKAGYLAGMIAQRASGSRPMSTNPD